MHDVLLNLPGIPLCARFLVIEAIYLPDTLQN